MQAVQVEEEENVSFTRFESVAATHEALNSVGYITDQPTAMAVWTACLEDLPILLEGPAGAGKTELAVAICKCTGMEMVRLQCFEGITDDDAIGRFDSTIQNLVAQAYKTDSYEQRLELIEAIRSKEFFMPGPLLKAIESPKRCLLLIDEIDKIPAAFEAMLLQLLSAWEISIAAMATTVPAVTKPLTIVTSNAEREIGFPMRRRCQFIQVAYPTPEMEASIVRRKTPNADPELHYFVAGFAKAMRTIIWKKPPSISEMVNLVSVMNRMGKIQLHSADRELFLPLVVKTREDRDKMRNRGQFEQIMKLSRDNAAELREKAKNGSIFI